MQPLTGPSALNITMISRLFENGAVTMIAAGSTHVFTSVGETHTFTVTYPAGTITAGQIVLYGVSNNPATFTGSEGDGGDRPAYLEDCSSSDEDEEITDDKPQQVFFDGRINSYDTGNPVVLFGINYGADEWGLEVYASGFSGLLFNVTPEQIAAIPECPEVNTLIAVNEANGITLYRLPQRIITAEGYVVCPFQLNTPTGEAGKTYVIMFDTLYPNTYYESWEE